ncbi:MAG: transporter substrate-binding domain-containing protein, partial [Campylobacterota bacterium]|nr:transporter substrate-binding domain-containing protein [Campylobacterota bacterium]
MRLLIYLLLQTSILFANTPVFTEDEKIWIKNNPMVKIAVMNYWNHDGDGNTIHTDYIKLLNRYGDINIVPIRYDSWKEGYGEVISNNDLLHGIMNLAWNKEREEKYFLYTKAYIVEPSYLVVRKNNNTIKNLKDLKDLKNSSVLSKEKSITDNIIKDISKDIKIVPIKSDNMMYEEIVTNKNIDAFITYKKDVNLLEKYNLKVIKTIYDKYSAASIGVKKQYPHLESIINKIYNIIPKDQLSNLQNKIYNDTNPYKVKSNKTTLNLTTIEKNY